MIASRPVVGQGSSSSVGVRRSWVWMGGGRVVAVRGCLYMGTRRGPFGVVVARGESSVEGEVGTPSGNLGNSDLARSRS